MSSNADGNARRDNYWPTVSSSRLSIKPLAGDMECDVAVLGAGIMGLNSALVLAEQGMRVVVAEASDVGAGASGRNGGLVVPSLPRIGPDDVIRELGETYGQRLVKLVADGARTVFDLIKRYGMRCDAVQNGWLNPAHAAELEAGLQARVGAWQRAGARTEWLGRDAAYERIGSNTFHGALFDPTGGHVNPYFYTQELARVAIAAGATICSETPIQRIDRDGERFVLHAPAGKLVARTVLQCTNAMPPGVDTDTRAKAVSHSFVPLTVFQLATKPLSSAIRATLLPGNESLSDTRNNLFAIRHTADGRLVTGGMAPLSLICAESRLQHGLARRMARIFPQLEGVSFDYIWRGRAALTPDFLPRLFEIEQNWFAPIGCNGRGIVMATALGQRLARYLLERDDAILPLPRSAPRPIKAHAVARYAPQLLLPLGIIQDALRH